MDLYYHRLLEGFDGLASIQGIESYGKRAAILCKSEDILLLDGKRGLPELEILNSIGLGPKPENVFFVDFVTERPWQENIENNRTVLKHLENLHIDNFKPFTCKSKIVHKLAQHLQLKTFLAPLELVYWGEDKSTILELGEKFGHAPRGFKCMSEKDFIDSWHKLKQMPNFTGEAVVKALQSASGLLSSVVHSEKEIAAFVKESGLVALGGGVLEEWHRTNVSPSINYEITKDGVQELFISEQLFEDAPPCYGKEGTKIHRGNVCPAGFTKETLDNIRNAVAPFAQAFFEKGYFGFVGFDTILVADKVFVVEANPRVTGPHYGFFPTMCKNASAFRLRNETINKSIDPKQLSDALGSLLLQGAKGYYFFNFSPGKFTGVLMGDNKTEIENMEQELNQKLESLR